MDVNQPESQDTTLGDTQVLSVKAQPDAHTRFLGTLMGMEKAYEIPGSIITKGDQTDLPKKVNQADQGSEMNVITPGLVRRLILDVMPLSQLRFQGMTMMTADHKETSLTSFVCFDFISEGISRAVRCFVGPETYDKWGNIVDTFRLILGIPWLYSVNAVISIKNSSIQIGDSALGEVPRFIQGPEMCFHSDHNLLMYPRSIFPSERFKEVVEDDSSSDEEESESSGDNLSDVDDTESKSKKQVFL